MTYFYNVEISIYKYKTEFLQKIAKSIKLLCDTLVGVKYCF